MPATSPAPHRGHRSRRDDAPTAVARALADRLAVAGPDPDFRDRLRRRLVAVGSVAPSEPPVAARPPRRWLPRLAVAGMAGVVAVGGVGFATSHALPGEPLYGLKRQVESWQLDLRSGDASRGREQLAFARTRLAEVTALTRGGSLAAGLYAAAPLIGAGPAVPAADGRIASTLRTMDAETRAGAAALTSAAHRGDVHAARDLLRFTQVQTADLRAVRPALPADAEPAAARSDALLVSVQDTAMALPGASGGDPTTSPAAPSPTTPSSAPTGTPSDGPASTPAPTGDPTPATSSTAPPATPPTAPTSEPAPTTSPTAPVTTPPASPSAPAPTTSTPTASGGPSSTSATPSGIALPLPSITISVGPVGPVGAASVTARDPFTRLLQAVVSALLRIHPATAP